MPTGLKAKIRRGELVLGTWITINSPDVVDALSDLPLDWVVIDLEHGPLDIGDLQTLIMPLRSGSVAPLARVPWNDHVWVKRVLDVGVVGVVAPWVNSREDAEALVRYSTYPPRGVRGVGPRRASRYGLKLREYVERFEREERVLVAQIETREAVERVEEIVSIEGIDVAFIGPLDLSFNLGIPLQLNHEKLREAMKKVLKACERHDVTPGIFAPTPEDAKARAEEGFRFIAINMDINALTEYYKNALEKLGRL